MKPLRHGFPLGLALLLLAGCASHQGAYAPADNSKSRQELTAKFVLMDPGAQRSVTSAGLQETRLDDGRLKVSCILQNRENRRIQVQVQCVFKDPTGFSTGDETPWENVILTENGMETLTFTSLNNKAATYTVRVRQAR
ncbi:MAG: DUF1425 domain-containing protein [Verrucomicrobiales bacterium]|nr:DUF1425 domain-containing protein [Verrucomicrobiales bacterium]